MKACFLGVVAWKSHRSTFVAPEPSSSIRRAMNRRQDARAHTNLIRCAIELKSFFFHFIRSRRIAVNVEPRRTNNSQIGMHKLHGMNRHVFRDIRRLIRKARVPLKSVTGKAMRINDIYRKTGELRKCQEIIATWR